MKGDDIFISSPIPVNGKEMGYMKEKFESISVKISDEMGSCEYSFKVKSGITLMDAIEAAAKDFLLHTTEGQDHLRFYDGYFSVFDFINNVPAEIYQKHGIESITPYEMLEIWDHDLAAGLDIEEEEEKE